MFALHDFSLVTDCPSSVHQKDFCRVLHDLEGDTAGSEGLMKEDSQPDLAFFNLPVETAIQRHILPKG